MSAEDHMVYDSDEGYPQVYPDTASARQARQERESREARERLTGDSSGPETLP